MCSRGGILTAVNYLESKNGKYRLEFHNSGLHLSCGLNSIWKYGFSNNEALYLDLEGLSLVLLRRRYSRDIVLYKPVTIWKQVLKGTQKGYFCKTMGIWF